MKKFCLLIHLLIFGYYFTSAQKPVANFTFSKDSVCLWGDTISFYDLSSNNPTSWQWYFQGAYDSLNTDKNPQGIFYTTEGKHNVKLVVSNSFGSDSLTLYNLITANPNPNTPVITEKEGTIGGLCWGQTTDTLFCNPDSGYAYYQWYINANPIQGATLPVLIVDSAANYDLRVTNIHGCGIAVGFEYFPYQGVPLINFEADTTMLCAGDSINFNNQTYLGNTYHWSFPGAVPDSSNMMCPVNIYYHNAGKYDVTLSSSNSWGSNSMTKHAYIVVDSLPCSTGIHEVVDKPSMFIYPNPVIASFTLQLKAQVKDAEVVIYDVLGKVMIRKSFTGNSMSIEKGSLESGVYFVTVANAERQYIQKIIIE